MLRAEFSRDGSIGPTAVIASVRLSFAGQDGPTDVVLDQARVAGTMTFDPGIELPRHDKRLLERSVANAFLMSLCHHDGSTFENLRSAAFDPPDVEFSRNGEDRSLELVELTPDCRLEKDAILTAIRRDIISQLVLSEYTKGIVVTITLVDDNSKRLKPGRIAKQLATTLGSYLNNGDTRDQNIEVPSEIGHAVKSISIFREDQTGHPLLSDEREPLIGFTAQDTIINPREDCPAIVEAQLSKKSRLDFAMPTWLLLWSNHPSLQPYRNELDKAIGFYLQSHPTKFERIFHLHLFHGSGPTEFPIKQ